MQRALMQFFKPENYFAVREALIEAGRQDLIGQGCDCLIPAKPPKEAIEARRRQANRRSAGTRTTTTTTPSPTRRRARSPASGVRDRRSRRATGRGGSRSSGGRGRRRKVAIHPRVRSNRR